jgi:hypothetical protein
MKLTKQFVKKEVEKGVKGHQKEVDKDIKEVEKDIDKIEKENLLYLLANTKQKGILLHNKFREHASTAIIAAFSFLIALSWKDLIVQLVDENIKPSLLESHPYLSKLIIALIVTIFSVVAIIFVSKWSGKEK